MRPWHFLFAASVTNNIYFIKAAEQAKASPALVAKDPSTSTNKKEEEDLAKGKEFLSLWWVFIAKSNHINSFWLLWVLSVAFLLFLCLFAHSYRALTEGAASAATDVPVQPLPQRLQPFVLAQVRWQESPRHLWLWSCRGQRAHFQVGGDNHHLGRQVNLTFTCTIIS